MKDKTGKIVRTLTVKFFGKTGNVKETIKASYREVNEMMLTEKRRYTIFNAAGKPAISKVYFG